jgi:hypothetical protein
LRAGPAHRAESRSLPIPIILKKAREALDAAFPLIAVWRFGGDGTRVGTLAADDPADHPRERLDVASMVARWLSAAELPQCGEDGIIAGEVVAHSGTPLFCGRNKDTKGDSLINKQPIQKVYGSEFARIRAIRGQPAIRGFCVFSRVSRANS